jgi:hypothetical protein
MNLFNKRRVITRRKKMLSA